MANDEKLVVSSIIVAAGEPDTHFRPSKNLVEVVRCEDCKYWDYGDCYRLELSRPDDFCSYGERRAPDAEE